MVIDYRLNLKLATDDELIKILRECEETHDGKMRKRVQDEIHRRMTYDY